ncbi:hypothetical protein CTAYLR_003045 [Chrysophaeum taylorii]|uniref:Uncharacterized protein n=1 Tax=Chrysophaeum taylorii TaxID=2483200 RepID=A0AAD7U5E7_9STRA|nr:hypothetical protein CTAYLR_003045 [Chrysophaeum taylorii]
MLTSMSLWHKVATGVISATGIPGLMMIGVGVAPQFVPAEMSKKFPEMVELWSKILKIKLTPRAFFPFVGACKIFGIVSMWGVFGPALDTACTLLYALLCACATYTHAELGEPVGPPVFIGSLCLLRLFII